MAGSYSSIMKLRNVNKMCKIHAAPSAHSSASKQINYENEFRCLMWPFHCILFQILNFNLPSHSDGLGNLTCPRRR